MSIYKIQFQLKSSIRTPFQADTIFGHLCWALRFLEGENKLEDWLGSFQKSPTLITNAFVLNKFPRPNLPPSFTKRVDGVKDPKLQDSVLKTATIYKKMKKISLIDEKWLIEHQKDFASESFFLYLFGLANESMKVSRAKKIKTIAEVAITHNTYDRLMGRVLEGSLYDWEETFYRQTNGEPQSFWFLIKTETLSKNQIESILDFIEFSGFGADKSIGKGQINISAIEPYNIDVPNNANAFISLSNFVPAKPEDLNGYYKPITKFGKLGGEWAAGGIPFKKPIVMLEAGAVIKDDSFSESKIYGKLQTGIHSNNKIVQYGYAFPFPICLKEESA